MTHRLPPLDYPYDALAPAIDPETMRIHHTRHHQAYVDALNAALAAAPAFAPLPTEELLTRLPDLPDPVRGAVRNHAGGHANHAQFWKSLSPAPSAPAGRLERAIRTTFGGLDPFRQQFEAAALSRFGSGWAWLVEAGGRLEVTSTPDQDSPLAAGQWPLLGLDLWEHAYYLRYQHRRAEYVRAWWGVVNWPEVERRFEAAANGGWGD